jgi:hypothetical protein
MSEHEESKEIGFDAWAIDQMKARLERHAYFVEPYATSISASLLTVEEACTQSASAFIFVGVTRGTQGWSAYAEDSYGRQVAQSGETITQALDLLATSINAYQDPYPVFPLARSHD